MAKRGKGEIDTLEAIRNLDEETLKLAQQQGLESVLRQMMGETEAPLDSPFQTIIPSAHPLASVIRGLRELPQDTEIKDLPRGKTKRDLLRWATDKGKTWSKNKIAQVQMFLGLDNLVELGKFDELTRQTLASYHIVKGQMGPDSIRQAMSIYRDKLAESLEDERIVRANRLTELKNRAYNTWSSITGVPPDVVSTDWLSSKFEEGWSNAQFYRFVRNTPSFKRRFPGIPENMLPTQYMNLELQFRDEYYKSHGKPATKDSFAEFLNSPGKLIHELD